MEIYFTVSAQITRRVFREGTISNRSGRCWRVVLNVAASSPSTLIQSVWRFPPLNNNRVTGFSRSSVEALSVSYALPTPIAFFWNFIEAAVVTFGHTMDDGNLNFSSLFKDRAVFWLEAHVLIMTYVIFWVVRCLNNSRFPSLNPHTSNHGVHLKPTLFGFKLTSGPSGYPRCPFCKTKEYATLRDLRQHMLWKHWMKIPTIPTRNYDVWSKWLLEKKKKSGRHMIFWLKIRKNDTDTYETIRIGATLSFTTKWQKSLEHLKEPSRSNLTAYPSRTTTNALRWWL